MKKILEYLSCLFFGFTFAFLMIYILDVNWERRFTLYHIRNELKKDISKAEVEEIINRHQASFIYRQDYEDQISLRVHLGMADSLSLGILFSDDKLKSANFFGEDNPMDVPKDSPPNLE